MAKENTFGKMNPIIKDNSSKVFVKDLENGINQMK